jgi:hypothetical protein
VGLFFCIGEFATGLQQLLRGGLLLIGWDEGIGYESFVTGWGGVLGCAGFEGAHVSGVEGADHLQEQAGEGLGHSHLN